MPHPIQLVATDDLERSRLTVFFRLLLAIPHFIVMYFWAIVTVVVVVIAWFLALITGRVPDPLHAFIAAFLRYRTRLGAYLLLLANPYPPFSGSSPYPVELHIAPPAPQHRLKTLFRYFLAIPALIVGAAAGFVSLATAYLGWFAILATGRMPRGLRDAGIWALRVDAQVNAYHFLLTDRYPNFSPSPELDAEADSV